MGILATLVLVIAIVTSMVAASVVFSTWWRDQRRAQQEDRVALAAQEYLARFEVHARIVAVTLPDKSIVLMVETPPHKKLRFSYIIEQPIKHFVLKQTQVEIARLFWRFPLPPKNSQMPDVQYGYPTTQILPEPQAVAAPAIPPSVAPETTEARDDEDEYFQRQAYQIEEVSWEDYSKLDPGNERSEK